MKKIADVAQIFALVLGLFSIIVTFTFLVNEAIPAMLEARGKAFLPFIPLFLLVAYGYFLTWRRELSGSIIIMAGSLTIILYFMTLPTHTAGAFLLGLPFMISGVLLLMHWRTYHWQNKHHHRRA